jgi:hypothetical protein
MSLATRPKAARRTDLPGRSTRPIARQCNSAGTLGGSPAFPGHGAPPPLCEDSLARIAHQIDEQHCAEVFRTVHERKGPLRSGTDEDRCFVWRYPRRLRLVLAPAVGELRSMLG